MKTLLKKLNNRLIAGLLLLLLPFIASAQKMVSAEEEAKTAAQTALYSEIAIGVLFVAAVAGFLIYKAKHDKKVRERQMQQMRNVQARRKAA